jgi:flagellar secretion chaperone FliS
MNTARARARFVNDGLATLSGPSLLLALYRRLERDLDEASDALAIRSLDAAHGALVHAQEIVQELAFALDTTAWPDATALRDLYGWLLDELVRANVAKDRAAVDSCRQVVAGLHSAWADASCGSSVAS